MTAGRSSCCGPSAGAADRQLRCPADGSRGARVPLDTVKALLTETALCRLATTTEHGFCPDPACGVVYFTPAGDTYLVTDVRVPVWQKEPFGARMICYCFAENEADMRTELAQSGKSGAVARVRAHIKAGRCACESRNPLGVCCLGDVGEAVRRVAAAVAAGG